MTLVPALDADLKRPSPLLYAASIATVSAGATAMVCITFFAELVPAGLLGPLYGLFTAATILAVTGLIITAINAPPSVSGVNVPRLLNVGAMGLGLSGAVFVLTAARTIRGLMTSADIEVGLLAAMLLCVGSLGAELIRRARESAIR